MGSRNVGYFPCQAPQASLPHPKSMFFLSKKTCRNTIGSPATRNQCESHRAQNSVKIGVLFRTWNDSGWGRALQNFSRFEQIRRKTFTAVVCRVHWTVKFKLNPRCDHLVRTFFAANLFARYTVAICPFIQQVHKKNVFAQFSPGKCCFCRL